MGNQLKKQLQSNKDKLEPSRSLPRQSVDSNFSLKTLEVPPGAMSST